MALIATAKEPAPTIEAGSYVVRCMEIVEDEIENSSFNPHVYRLRLETEDKLTEEGNPVPLDAICSRTLSPKSKLWRWLVAFGLQPEIGKNIDLEDIVEKEALAIVILKETETGVFSRVDDIVPLPVSTRRAAAPADDIGSWWAEVRAAGPTVKEATDKAVAMYKKEPKDCTPLERQAVLQALTA